MAFFFQKYDGLYTSEWEAEVQSVEDKPSCWLVLGWKKCVYGIAYSHERLLQTSLRWKQDQAHRTARWDLHHLRGTVPKLLLCPGQLCLGLASVLPGSVSQSYKLSCSSEVSSASTPRSEQNPQWSLLQYFSSSIKGILIDLFTSRHKVRTRGPYAGIKRVLFVKRCAASFLQLWEKSLTWV